MKHIKQLLTDAINLYEASDDEWVLSFEFHSPEYTSKEGRAIQSDLRKKFKTYSGSGSMGAGWDCSFNGTKKELKKARLYVETKYKKYIISKDTVFSVESVGFWPEAKKKPEFKKDDFVQWKGKKGVVVRYDDSGPESPFYVVSFKGKALSEKIPQHKLEESYLNEVKWDKDEKRIVPKWEKDLHKATSKIKGIVRGLKNGKEVHSYRTGGTMMASAVGVLMRDFGADTVELVVRGKVVYTVKKKDVMKNGKMIDEGIIKIRSKDKSKVQRFLNKNHIEYEWGAGKGSTYVLDVDKEETAEVRADLSRMGIWIGESVELDEEKALTFVFPDDRRAKQFHTDIENSSIGMGNRVGNKVTVTKIGKWRSAVKKAMIKNKGKIVTTESLSDEDMKRLGITDPLKDKNYPYQSGMKEETLAKRVMEWLDSNHEQ